MTSIGFGWISGRIGGMRYSFITLGIIASLIAMSCDKQDMAMAGGFPADGVVRIETGPVEAAVADGGVSQAASAGSGSVPSSLGLFLDYGASDKYSMSNILWDRKTSGDWTSQMMMLWKNAKTEVGVYSYSPYVTGSTVSAVSFNIPSDQSKGTDAADLLWFADPSFIPGDETTGLKDGKLAISFKHALVKLKVRLSMGDRIGEGLTVKEVRMKNTISQVSCDLTASGIVTPGTSMTDIRMHAFDDNCYEAIFWPGFGQKAGARMLTVVMSSGSDFDLTIDEDFSFTAGRAYTFEVVLNRKRGANSRCVSRADTMTAENDDVDPDWGKIIDLGIFELCE